MNQLRRVSRHRTPTKSPCERCKNTRIAHEVHRQMSSTRMHRATLQFRCLYFWLTCLVVSQVCLVDWLTAGAARHLPRPSGPPASVRIFHTAPRPTTYRVRRSLRRMRGSAADSVVRSHRVPCRLRSKISTPAELATYSRPSAIDGETICAARRSGIGLVGSRRVSRMRATCRARHRGLSNRPARVRHMCSPRTASSRQDSARCRSAARCR